MVVDQEMIVGRVGVEADGCRAMRPCHARHEKVRQRAHGTHVVRGDVTGHTVGGGRHALMVQRELQSLTLIGKPVPRLPRSGLVNEDRHAPGSHVGRPDRIEPVHHVALDHERKNILGNVMDRSLLYLQMQKLDDYRHGRFNDFCEGCTYCPRTHKSVAVHG